MYEQGKTLIELMVTLSIAAVIGAGAAPSLQRFARQQQLSHATNTLHSAAQFAREQAIYLEQTITISNTDGNWSHGAIIYVDADSSGEHSADEEILRTIPPLGGVEALGNRHVSHYISYRPDGSAHLKSNAFQVGTLTICPSTGEEGRQLVISIGGRIRRADSRCGE